jgi:hypothetical protein
MGMTGQLRPDVHRFLLRFREAGDRLDVDSIRDCFLETFLSLDPNTASTLDREIMLAALPKRRALFDSLGAGEAQLHEARELPLDETHTLVRTVWKMPLNPTPAGRNELLLRSTFLLRRTSDGWRIAAYLNHEDVTALVATHNGSA